MDLITFIKNKGFLYFLAFKKLKEKTGKPISQIIEEKLK